MFMTLRQSVLSWCTFKIIIEFNLCWSMVALRKVFILLSAQNDLSDTALVAGITNINLTRIINWVWRAFCPTVRLFMTLTISVSVMLSMSENKYYRGIDSAIQLQILQNVGDFSVSHKFRKCPDICTECYFFKIIMNVSCGNTEFKHQNKNKTFPDSQCRAALFVSPFLQNLKCKITWKILSLGNFSLKF